MELWCVWNCLEAKDFVIILCMYCKFHITVNVCEWSSRLPKHHSIYTRVTRSNVQLAMRAFAASSFLFSCIYIYTYTGDIYVYIYMHNTILKKSDTFSLCTLHTYLYPSAYILNKGYAPLYFPNYIYAVPYIKRRIVFCAHEWCCRNIPFLKFITLNETCTQSIVIHRWWRCENMLELEELNLYVSMHTMR